MPDGGAAAIKKRRRTIKARRAQRVAFDTSALVAAVIVSHPHHAVAAPWVGRVQAGELPGVIAAHTLAETYAILTTLPHQPRITPAAAIEIIDFLSHRFHVVTLVRNDYSSVAHKLASAGLIGGITYDALAVYAAKKAGAASIVTCNRRDFIRLGELFGVTIESLLPRS